MTLTLKDIQEAADRIAPYIHQTPLLRMENLDAFLGCEVHVKLESMQVTNAFKIRGAMNKILKLEDEDLEKGIITTSSGNHGRAVAFAAKRLGIHATVVVPDSGSKYKAVAIEALGAELVRCDVSERFDVAETLARKYDYTYIPPFDDYEVMAGQGTVGLEIAAHHEDFNYIILPTSGGGLLASTSTAIKNTSASTKVYGAEPASLPRYSESLARGELTRIPRQKTIADALVTDQPGERNFPIVKELIDGMLAVSEEYILKGMKLLMMEGKIVAEPSSSVIIGAILEGLLKVSPEDKVCFVISGGNVGLDILENLKDVDY
ncbi:threonine ammonia-lyase [Salinicoccus halodurans]|uniref:threonine ammonia-lyase n=1 Tax=Salinicoccus halodurans TaxID=407035 RepID=A0A0F7D3T4_9STAP|nr:threonine/serine dehydratase [Salinicoccus halodurans]AKG73040.1 threonine dehydratase [Salinicoccus halodurans]SFK77915.1 threonine dehydratase [Salinicoccus halodurans]